MSDIRTLCDFLEQTQNPYRVFDLGRRVAKLSNEQFKAFETNDAPYPYPLQGHAWFGIVNWNQNNSEEQLVLFLKLPLDEAGRLVYAARDDLIYRMLKSFKETLDAQNEGKSEVEDTMSNSPYGFTPNQERMAVFHAKALKTMGQPPSKYYQHARDYFSGTLGYEQWAFVGFQGIADISAHWKDDNNATLLAKAIPQLPDQPFDALCKCLENEQITTTLVEPLLARFDNLVDDQHANPLALSAILRAISFTPAEGLRRAAIKRLLHSPHKGDLDLLVTISGRCWEDLKDGELCHLFLETLANSEHGAQIFSQLLADILYLPDMREPVMAQLRNPDRSLALETMVGAMFGRER